TFAPTTPKPEGGSPTDFDKKYRQLQTELHELRRQFHELSASSPGGAPPKPSASSQRPAPRRSAAAAAAMPASRELFRQRCVKCHGADGTGSPMRGSLPEGPAFTGPSWRGGGTDVTLGARRLAATGRQSE